MFAQNPCPSPGNAAAFCFAPYSPDPGLSHPLLAISQRPRRSAAGAVAYWPSCSACLPSPLCQGRTQTSCTRVERRHCKACKRAAACLSTTPLPTPTTPRLRAVHASPSRTHAARAVHVPTLIISTCVMTNSLAAGSSMVASTAFMECEWITAPAPRSS